MTWAAAAPRPSEIPHSKTSRRCLILMRLSLEQPESAMICAATVIGHRRAKREETRSAKVMSRIFLRAPVRLQGGISFQLCFFLGTAILPFVIPGTSLALRQVKEEMNR